MHSVVRKLIRETPSKSGIIISGREAYFDSEAEMMSALGLSHAFQHYVVKSFDDRQVRSFLGKMKLSGDVPEWIPTRPLLLHYLASEGLLKDAMALTPTTIFPRGQAWCHLMDMIAQRESEQSEGVDQASILEFMGVLAIRARQYSGAQKSFTPSEMDDIFYLATGNTVSEQERRTLLRLPGLGIATDNPGNRAFIDVDFMSAASATALYKYLSSPYGSEVLKKELRDVAVPLSDAGIEVVGALCKIEQLQAGAVRARLLDELKHANYQLAYDVLTVLAALGESELKAKFFEIYIQEMDLCNDSFFNMYLDFDKCLIDRLSIPDQEYMNGNVKFAQCLIGVVDGRVSMDDLEKGQFLDCEVDQFSDHLNVNSSVLESSLPLAVRVLVVTLRKIFVQSGSARLESALLRGLDHRSRAIAPDVIESLIRRGYITAQTRQGKTTYAGVRSKRSDALMVINSPNNANLNVIKDCMDLSR